MKKLSLKKELLSILLIFIFGSIIQTAFYRLTWLTSFDEFLKYGSPSGIMWVMFWKGSEYSVLLLDSWVSWIEAPVKRFVSALVIIVIYISATFFGIFFVFSLFVWGNTYEEFTSSFGWNDLIAPVVVTLLINFFMHGRAFLYALREQAIDNERLKTEQVAIRYNSLKDQLNPHFLFNSLNALSSLVVEDQDKAVRFIRKLSDVYRYVLDQRSSELVSLDEELEFLNSYIFLQQIRFDGSLLVKNELKLGNRDIMVLPLSLQLLFENAIKHNVISEESPLSISVYSDDVTRQLVIENTINLKKHTDSFGIGLENLKLRYAHFTKNQVEVIENATTYTVKIPYLNVQ